jgi:hypothetical protein
MSMRQHPRPPTRSNTARPRPRTRRKIFGLPPPLESGARRRRRKRREGRFIITWQVFSLALSEIHPLEEEETRRGSWHVPQTIFLR